MRWTRREVRPSSGLECQYSHGNGKRPGCRTSVVLCLSHIPSGTRETAVFNAAKRPKLIERRALLRAKAATGAFSVVALPVGARAQTLSWVLAATAAGKSSRMGSNTPNAEPPKMIRTRLPVGSPRAPKNKWVLRDPSAPTTVDSTRLRIFCIPQVPPPLTPWANHTSVSRRGEVLLSLYVKSRHPV